MNAEQRREVESAFQKVADLPREERHAYLEVSVPAGTLRRQVALLLEAHESDTAVDFLRTPDASQRPGPGEHVGDRIGPYKLLGLIGQGAFGDVYVAEQTTPFRRCVALKIVKLGMDTKEVVARFEAEQQALALMDHPNIAKVHGAGATKAGRPYFVMEYVPGVPLTQYCDEQRLPIKQRLRLLLVICDAIQHAHQKGIIHRDIKPSNILVKIVGDQPVPKVIDFGIAKATGYSLTERTLFTDRGRMIGTPEYMSPEQAGVSGHLVDTRTDIYSQGVVLYELLTGTLPFNARELRSGSIEQIQNAILRQQPPKPSARVRPTENEKKDPAKLRRTNTPSLRRRLRGELDWITMKAMDKDRSRRYATSSEMAADIERHLEHQPVMAGPPSTGYRFRKFVRRNRTGVIATVLVMIALAWGAAGLAVGFFQASHERDRARRVVPVALSLIMEGMAVSGSEVSPDSVEGVYWALAETYGEPPAGKAETLEQIRRFALAAYLLRHDQPEEAEAILTSMSEWIDQQWGTLNAASLMVREALADARLTLGMFGEAEPIALETYAGYRELYGLSAPQTVRAIERLIMVYDGWDRRAEAARWRDELAATQLP